MYAAIKKKKTQKFKTGDIDGDFMFSYHEILLSHFIWRSIDCLGMKFLISYEWHRMLGNFYANTSEIKSRFLVSLSFWDIQQDEMREYASEQTA